MPDWSRRDLLRASAGAAAVAVPMAALGSNAVSAAARESGGAELGSRELADRLDRLDGPVLFRVRDARRGEVSILHGTDEVVVRDRQLVARILRAATSRNAL
jgi:hypothetical protein